MSGIVEALARGRRERTLAYALSLLVGLVGGAVVVAYRVAISVAESARLDLVGAGLPAVAVWTAVSAATGLLVARLVSSAPLARGSGIPQVKAGLMRLLPFSWRRELPAKFLGGVAALGSGLSLGREGPSIHLGALVGAGLSELGGAERLRRHLVTAGSAAGVAAAFNAPLAGVLFCLEELHRSFSPVMLTCAMTAAASATAVSWLALGPGAVFELGVAEVLPIEGYPLVILLGAVCGLLGAAFNRTLLATQARARRILPSEGGRMALAFAAAALVAVYAPSLTGGGHGLVEAAAGGGLGLGILLALLAGKLAFTASSYASGAPGGIFLPMLALGALAGGSASRAFAGLGLDSGLGLLGNHDANFVLIGMVGFFTAVVRAPVTGAVLITEMSGSFAHFPALMTVSVVASLVASALRSEPIYDSLLDRLLASSRGPASSSAAAAGEVAAARGDPTESGDRAGRPGAPYQGQAAEGAVLLELVVGEGSVLDLARDARDALPDGAVLVGVGRGEREYLPRSGLELQPGDRLSVLAPAEEAASVKARLAELCRRPKPGSPEAEGD